jgi:tripartite-type tricarboxylate transporter receptor subunit TctC
VFVPAATPPQIIQKLNAGLNAMLKEPGVTERLTKLNVEYRPNTPEEFRAFVAAEMEKWSRIVKEANIKLT